MSRILDEGGAYSPELPAVSVPAPVEAADLPQVKADPYANVDASDFSTAADMSREQLMTMADIAASRNQLELAMAWKQAATERVRQDQNDADAQRMIDMLGKSGYMPPPNTQIVDIDRSTPWSNDETYRELAHSHGEMKAQLDEMDAVDDDFFELSGKMAVTADRMQIRKGEITDNLAATGAWTAQDQLVLDANKSLAEKSAQIANMMNGSGIE